MTASSEVHRKRDILENAVKDLEQAMGLLRQMSQSLALAYQGLGTAYSLLEAFDHSQANLYEAIRRWRQLVRPYGKSRPPKTRRTRTTHAQQQLRHSNVEAVHRKPNLGRSQIGCLVIQSES